MKQHKILHLIKGLGLGGAEKLIAEAARFWDRDRFEYQVAYVLPWKDQLVPTLEAQGIPVWRVGGVRGFTPEVASRLRWLIRHTRTDLVHAHLPATGILARLISQAPVVYTEHNLANSYRPLTRSLNRLTYRRNRAVIAVSDAVAQSLTGYPGPEPIVIPNGVAASNFSLDPEAARRELELPPDTSMVVHVGNIRPGKGHEVLLEAFRRLHARRPETVLVSVGGEKHPGDLARLQGRVKELGLNGVVRLMGRRPDALSFVAAADLYVNPSVTEGLPVSLLEAMVLGRPVVATAAGGVPGVVKDEETGLLVPSDDPQALSEALDRLLADSQLAGRLAEAGRALVERDYGLEPMVSAVEDVYCSVLDG